jgi:predicted dehydrogenase
LLKHRKTVSNQFERNSVKLMLGYPMRFNNKFIKLKEDMENGLIGDVENAHATCISSGPSSIGL